MNKKVIASFSCLLIFALLISVHGAHADPIPNINFQIGNGDSSTPGTSSISLILIITVLSVAPAILLMMTSFTRIAIVLGFVRTALGTQQMPPNQVIIGLALFMTLFVMSPTISEINTQAFQPYMKSQITQTQALEKASIPLKKFMFKQTREKDLLLFMKYTKTEKPTSYEDLPISVLVPAYAISELKTAMQMGFMVIIPFLVIDMVVASTLMAMGMMMLPPVMISLPFKILLFILVDGWYLVVKSLLTSFGT